MKITQFKKVLSLILCIVLIAAIASFTIGCNDNNNQSSEPLTPSQSNSKVTDNGVTEKGEGETQFYFNVVDVNGKESKFKIYTDKKTVGEALVELALIAGDEGEFGLYVKTVNGITLDYDKDGKYWAFYIDGEMAMSGVDSIDVTDGATYTFRAE